ncbi:B1 protein [Tribolium castaneum]|uniref:Odorant binding protein C11 n=1 Tax=Tribolium castaneum TaxID=7070 RepID=D6X4H4_TRICA|nr:PREDICTED: B1 protein [Tribolium castaneum]EEZ97739.1 odorant binding protein C11 [Tribolium castaneum]|eukprot:XP_967799.1 PREDICTED: B1 protein [Tribolium castaneum]
MKIVLCLLALATVALAKKCFLAEDTDKLEVMINECKTKTGVPDDILQKARNGEKIDDPKLREHALCMMKKSEMMNDAGEMQMDKIRARIKHAVSNEAEGTRIMNECAVKKDTPLATAYEMICCLIRNKNSVDE